MNTLEAQIVLPLSVSIQSVTLDVINPETRTVQAVLVLPATLSQNQLEVELPNQAQIEQYLLASNPSEAPDTCQRNISVSPYQNQVFVFDHISVLLSDNTLNTYQLRTSQGTVQWVYSTGAQSIQGSLKCEKNQLQYQVTFAPGWNRLLVEAQQNDTSTLIHFSNLLEGPALSWVALPQLPQP